MKEVASLIGIVACGALLLCGVGWLFQGNDFFMFQYFAPKYEAVRRSTFEQSKAFNQGMIQELQSMQFQYVSADPAHKAALADIILHRAADYDLDKLPPDLRQFVETLKKGRTQ